MISIHSRIMTPLPEYEPLLRPAKPLLDTRAEDLNEYKGREEYERPLFRANLQNSARD
jgi:hypothetical protein